MKITILPCFWSPLTVHPQAAVNSERNGVIMKRRYSKGLFCLFVLTNFLFHFFYLSIPGLILCVVGIWNKVCLWLGLGILLLDLLLSIIEQWKLAAVATSESDNPEFNELMDEFCNNGLAAFRVAVDGKMQAKNTSAQTNSFDENREAPMDIQAFRGKIKETVVDLMLSYRAGFSEKEAPFTEANVAACEALLVDYLETLETMEAPTDESIMEAVKTVTLALNDLCEEIDYGMIETMEREAIWEIIQEAAVARGLSDVPDDVTEQWREW